MHGMSTPPVTPEDIAAIATARDRIVGELRKRIVGQDHVIDLMLIAIFAQGHGLFVGVPGLAKTLLIATLAESVNLSFSRIQFTPDLMPSDITGTDILEQDPTSHQRAFKFIKGPIFCNILLADEINRTPPKTQAALLQAMQEKRVTASGQDYELSLPFLVFATQNPIEQEGTYPLPEAQLDRFMVSIQVDYPSFNEELEIVATTTGLSGTPTEAVLDQADLIKMQQSVLGIVVAPDVIRYAVELATRSRPQSERAPAIVKQYVSWGAGPRASQFLILGAKARAALRGRSHASFDDVSAVAQAVLGHRVLVNFQAEAERISSHDVVEDIVRHAPRHGEG